MRILDIINDRFDTAVFSAPGGRTSNQDAYAYKVKGKFGCWVLCDGLGGHKGGEIAAKLASVECVNKFFRKPGLEPESLINSLEAANNMVHTEREKSIHTLMSTTAVMLIAGNNQALWAHVGDSRLYYFKEKKVFRQTADHSLTYKWMEIGEIKPEEIRGHADRNRLLRVLGTEEIKPEVEKSVHLLEPGDAFLLCTDGFWEYVTENEMETFLLAARNAQSWLNEMVKTITQRQPQNADNYSAITVIVK